MCNALLLIYFSDHIQQKLITDESDENWLNILFSKLWKSEKKDPTESSGIFSEIWNSIIDDFEFVRLCILGFISKEVSPVCASFIQITCAMLLIFIMTIGYSGYITWKTGKQSASKSNKKNPQISWSLFTQHISIISFIKTLAILALLISIPLEYMRMYQEQVATKVAHMKGVSKIYILNLMFWISMSIGSRLKSLITCMYLY